MKRLLALGTVGVLFLFLIPNRPIAATPEFIVVRPPIVKLRDKPNKNATVIFTSNQSIIFEVLKTSNNYHLVPLLNGFEAWINSQDVKKYKGRIPPPPYRMGVSHPVSEESLKELEKKQAIQQSAPRPNSGRFKYPEIPSNLNLDINGFFETKWSFRDFSDGRGGNISVNDPRWDTINNDPVYLKIPRDVIRGDPQLQLRYQLNIEGEVDKDLRVQYNLEQEPDLPGRYDININYKNSQLTFFHFDESFVDGEYITVRKALDGIRAKTFTNDWEAKIAIGRQRSEPQRKIFNGNGQEKYALGNTSILRGSLRIFLNNRRLEEDIDFTTDYFKGEIIFKVAPQSTDSIKAIYEFTNPIEDFIPALSRKDFIGAQFKWQPQTGKITNKRSFPVNQLLWPTTSTDNISTHNFKLRNTPVVVNTDEVKLNNKILKRNKDYFIKNLKGEIELRHIQLKTTDKLTINYDAYETSRHSDAFIGEDSPGPFLLDHKFIIYGSLQVSLDGQSMKEGIDYTVDYENGEVLFKFPVPYPNLITIDYKYILSTTKVPEKKDRPLKLGVTYLKESVRAEEQELILTQVNTVTVNSSNQAFLSQTPLITSEEFIATIQNGYVTTNIFQAQFPSEASNIESTLISAGYMTSDRQLTDSYTTFDTSFSSALNSIPTLTESDKEVIFNLLNSARDQIINVQVINPYSGLAQFTNPGLSTLPEITINYKYRKSFSTRFPFYIPDQLDQEREYINDGSRGFRINNIPIKYKGITEIRYFQSGNDLNFLQLRPGREFDVDYQENDPDSPGEEVIITFFKTGDRVESENLPNYPRKGERILILYDYAPLTDPNEGRLDQSMIGLTLENKINKNWTVEAELVGAQNNFEKPRLNAEITITPNGLNNQTYSLTHTNIIEDSETIFVRNANGVTQLRKGLEYIINYINGTIRFTDDPGENNQILAEFQYEDNSTTLSGKNTPFRLASKIGTSYTTDKLQANLKFKSIDKEFLPIGPILEQRGATVLDGKVNYKLNDDNHINVALSNRNMFIKTDTTGNDIYENEQDINISSESKLFNLFTTRLQARYFEEVQNESADNPTNNQRAIDNKTTSIRSETEFGPNNFKNFISYSHAENISDFKDQENERNSIVDSFQAKSNISIKNLLLLGNLTFSPHYLLSQEETKTNTDNNPSTSRENYGIGTSIAPFSGLKIDANFDKGLIKSTSDQGSENITELNNLKNRVKFTPFRWISTSYLFERRESESPYIGQSGKISESKGYRINRYSLYDMLTWSGIPRNHFTIAPLKRSYFTYNINNRNNSENNGNRLFDKETLSYSFNRFSPIPGLTLDKIQIREDLNTTFTNISNSTTSTNSTIRDTKQISGQLKYKPTVPILDLFTLSKNLKRQEEKRSISKIANSGTDNITEENNPETNESLTIRFQGTPLIREINRWTGIDLGPININFNELIFEKNTSRNTITSSNILNTPQTISRVADNQYKISRTLSGRIKPFNLVDFSFSVASGNEIFIRNLNSSTAGSTFKDNKNGNISTGLSFIPGINMTHSYNQTRLFQLRSPSINVTRREVANSIGDSNITAGTNQLQNTIHTATSKWTFSPLKNFDFTLGATYKQIDQIFTTINAQAQEITQQIGSLGVTYYPFKDLSLSYQLNFKFNNNLSNNSNSKNESTGNSGFFKAQYTLFNDQNMKVSFDYDRLDTKGQDLNTLDNQISEQGSGDSLQLNISEQDNTIETGTISINIKIPFDDSPYIDDLVLTASGYIKKVSDRINKDNSYDISGLILKGTLNF